MAGGARIENRAILLETRDELYDDNRLRAIPVLHVEFWKVLQQLNSSQVLMSSLPESYKLLLQHFCFVLRIQSECPAIRTRLPPSLWPRKQQQPLSPWVSVTGARPRPSWAPPALLDSLVAGPCASLPEASWASYPSQTLVSETGSLACGLQ